MRGFQGVAFSVQGFGRWVWVGGCGWDGVGVGVRRGGGPCGRVCGKIACEFVNACARLCNDLAGCMMHAHWQKNGRSVRATQHSTHAFMKKTGTHPVLRNPSHTP